MHNFQKCKTVASLLATWRSRGLHLFSVAERELNLETVSLHFTPASLTGRPQLVQAALNVNHREKLGKEKKKCVLNVYAVVL